MSLEVIKADKPERKLTDVQRLIEGWKILNNIPAENKEWNKVFYPRYSKTAKQLIAITGGLKQALDCMEVVFDESKRNNYSISFETILKRSHVYFEGV